MTYLAFYGILLFKECIMETKNAFNLMIEQNRTIYKDRWNKSVETQAFSNVSLERLGHMVAIPTQFYTNLSARDNVCLQYVVKGHGDYFVNDKLYRLKPHTLWLVPKDAYYYYVPDKNDPYEYFWIHCNGAGMRSLLNSIGICEQNPVVYYKETDGVSTAFHELISLSKADDSSPYRLLSKLYNFFDCCIRTHAPAEHNAAQGKMETSKAVDDAIAYLKTHFKDDVYLDDLAKAARLEKVYFVKKFKKQTGLSPMQFLIQFRVAHACRLLHTDMPLQAIAQDCGFQDFTNFLQRFKSVFGITPTQYRKRVLS